METQIVAIINHLGLGKIDFVTNFISWIPFIIVLWATLAFLLLFLDKKNGKLVFAGVVLALVFHFAISEGIFKHLLSEYVFRIRPYIAHPDLVTPIGKQFTDSSFPSSHMASTLAVLSVLTYYYRKAWPYTLLFVILMAFSRIHNGMHYPSDILAGSVLGMLYAIFAIMITSKFFFRKFK